MPPRATSKTAKSTRGFCSTIRALRGPEASALISSRSSMTTPSVEVMPTLRPMPLKMWEIIRDVVVLPFVPVTATIGLRDVEADHPGGLLRDLDVLGVRLERPVDGDTAGGHVAGQRQLDHLALRRDVGHR